MSQPSPLGPFKAAGTITTGYALERTSSGGVEKLQLASGDFTEAGGKLVVGIASESRTGTTDLRPVAVYGYGVDCPDAVAAAAWARTVKWLTADSGGKLNSAASGDIVIAVNVYGAAPGGANEVVRVLTCSPFVLP